MLCEMLFSSLFRTRWISRLRWMMDLRGDSPVGVDGFGEGLGLRLLAVWSVDLLRWE